MRRVWAPPQRVLARVRWLLALANLITAAILGPLILLDGAESSVLRLAGVAALVWLCWWKIRGYRREAFPSVGDGFEGLAFFVVGLALDNPQRILALLFVSSHFRALYGTDRGLIVRLVIYLAAYFGALMLAPRLPYPVLSPQVLLPALSLIVTAGVMRLVTVTLMSQERALARERILSRVGAELVAATDRESIYRPVLDAARALVGNAADVRALLWLGGRDGLRVVAGSGDRAEEAEGGSMASADLPEPMRELYFGEGDTRLNVVDGAGLRGAIDFAPKAAVVIAPLFIHGERRGALTVSADAPLPEEVQDGLKALGAEVALALEAQTLSDDLARRAGEARFRALVQNASDVILILDAAGVIRYASPSAGQLWKSTPDALCGKRAADFVHPDDAARGRDLLARAMQSPNANLAAELRYRGIGDAWRQGEVIVNHLLTEPSVEGVVVTCRDITERKRLGDELAKLEARREMDQIKSDFVNTASHELRTLLTALLGFSELLLAVKGDPADHRAWIETMHDEATRLAQLVDDLLDVSKMEDGRQIVRRQAVDVGAAVEHALAGLPTQAPSHPMKQDLREPLPPALADPDKVAQILTNLVSNAIKYSPAGGEVTISAGAIDGMVRLSVADRGLGLPAEELPRLFGRFHRIEDKDRRGIRGTGLGLYISKQLVELQGGRIWAESPGAGLGSTFHVELPVAQAGGDEAGGGQFSAGDIEATIAP